MRWDENHSESKRRYSVERALSQKTKLTFPSRDLERHVIHDNLG